MQLLQNDVDTLKCENDIRQQNLKAFFYKLWQILSK